MRQKSQSEKTPFGVQLGRGLSTLLLILLGFHGGAAQPEEGEWTVSLYTGPNIFLSDFNKKRIGWGVEYFPQYVLTEEFSVGLLAGYHTLRAEQIPPLSNPSFSYLKVHTIPMAVVGTWHVTSSRPLSPFLYAGVGVVLAVGKDGSNNYISTPHLQAYALFPVGAGVEYFLKKNLSIGFDIGARVLGVDNVEGVSRSGPDSYLIGRLGVNIYHLRSD